jgi:hypothetical protein
MTTIESIGDGGSEGRPIHAVTVFLNDRKHVVRGGTWLVQELKSGLGVEPAKVLEVITPEGLKELDDEAEIEVHEGEQFATRARTVTIFVDDHKHEIRAGAWVVSALKAIVGVDPAKVLAEITPHGLKDLDDSATIEVREGERFISHARSGGSSAP